MTPLSLTQIKKLWEPWKEQFSSHFKEGYIIWIEKPKSHKNGSFDAHTIEKKTHFVRGFYIEVEKFWNQGVCCLVKKDNHCQGIVLFSNIHSYLIPDKQKDKRMDGWQIGVKVK